MHTSCLALCPYLEDPADLEALVREQGQVLAACRLGEGGVILLGPGLLHVGCVKCMKLRCESVCKSNRLIDLVGSLADDAHLDLRLEVLCLLLGLLYPLRDAQLPHPVNRLLLWVGS